MCGIVGIRDFADRRIERAAVEAMADAVVHRGPDGAGFVSLDGIALGQRRLSIVDLRSIGNPPLANEDESVWVVLNGEIYNHLELRADLERKGHTFRTSTDTEVLVHLWEEYRGDLVRKLRGMFAFAIWDTRSRELYVARDRLGKKPLYYAFDGTRFAFASEIKSLLVLDWVSRDPNYHALDQYLSYQYVPAPLTAFAGIHKLPAAHALSLSEQRAVRIERYWNDESSRPAYADIDEACSDILATIRESVRIRSMADVPVGAFLSGGVDSALMVALLSECSSQPVKTVSIGFNEASHNELPYARLVAERYATDHHELVVTPDHASAIRSLAWHFDEPFADSSALPTYYVSQEACKIVKVAMSGDGGDEAFAGYRHYVDLLKIARIDRMPAGARNAIFGSLAGVLGAVRAPPRALRILRYLGDTAPQRYRRFMSIVKDEEKALLYSKRFDTLLAASDQADMWPHLAAPASDRLDWMMKHDRSHYLADGLMKKTDMASMANSLEVRCPLLDQEVIGKSCAIPTQWHLSDGRGKTILRRIARPFLPVEILDKPKTGFAVPLRDWLRGPLRELIRENLTDSIFIRRGLFNSAVVARMVDDQIGGRRDWSNRLWALLMLELWFRTYVDSSTVLREQVRVAI